MDLVGFPITIGDRRRGNIAAAARLAIQPEPETDQIAVFVRVASQIAFSEARLFLHDGDLAEVVSACAAAAVAAARDGATEAATAALIDSRILAAIDERVRRSGRR